MRTSPLLILLGALIGLLVVLFIGAQILQPSRPLMQDVSLSLSTITPDADGRDDVTIIQYTLNDNAALTVEFVNRDTQQRFRFRDGQERTSGKYEVPFSGVVDGYQLPGEQIAGTLERRLIPNGVYTWSVTASVDGREPVTVTGDLTITGGDTGLPEIRSFEISPQVFTPNRDGVDDRVQMNIFLAKAADLNVYLEGANGVRYPVSERYEGRKAGEAGAHLFDYDAGVDNNVPPPPDGDYTVVAVAQDKVGQRIRRTSILTLKDGGLPNAEIVPQATGRTVTWDTRAYTESFFTTGDKPGAKVEPPSNVLSTKAQITMPQNDLLLFRLTVRNYSEVPLRTAGPWPGTVYQWDQTRGAMLTGNSMEQDIGAWQVGIQCERSGSVYPWRWTIGAESDLTKVVRDNDTFYYLMPGKETIVWGAVRMTRLFPTRNPQKCFAALIHEGVAIPPSQDRLGEIDVELIVK